MKVVHVELNRRTLEVQQLKLNKENSAMLLQELRDEVKRLASLLATAPPQVAVAQNHGQPSRNMRHAFIKIVGPNPNQNQNLNHPPSTFSPTKVSTPADSETCSNPLLGVGADTNEVRRDNLGSDLQIGAAIGSQNEKNQEHSGGALHKVSKPRRYVCVKFV